MSKTSNAVKASQLGMPHGTAVGRLRKLLIFSMAQRLGEDLCFKCKARIETVADFTLEHKVPWLHGDINLFWDLNNIAFSHSWCNRPDRQNGGGTARRRVHPTGMNWCTRHKKFLLISNFSKNASHWTGLHTLCVECQHYTRDKKS